MTDIDPQTRRREMLGRIAAARAARSPVDHNGVPLNPTQFTYDDQGKLVSAERGEPHPEPKQASVPGVALPGVAEGKSQGALGFRGSPPSGPAPTTPIGDYGAPPNPRRQAGEER